MWISLVNFSAWICLTIPLAHQSSHSSTAGRRHRAADWVAGMADPDLAYSFPQSRPQPNHPAGHQERIEEHRNKESSVWPNKWGGNSDFVPKLSTLRVHLEMLCNRPGILTESWQLIGYMIYLLDTNSSSRAMGETCWRNIPRDEEQANGNKRETNRRAGDRYHCNGKVPLYPFSLISTSSQENFLRF